MKWTGHRAEQHQDDARGRALIEQQLRKDERLLHATSFGAAAAARTPSTVRTTRRPPCAGR